MSRNTQNMLLSCVILTINPDRYQSGVFCNDLSDHCYTACVHNGCSVKPPVLICHRRLLKNFNGQAFLHDLASVNWYRISLIPSVEDTWTFFIVNKHSSIKKMRIKNRFSPWFDCDLAELLHLKNCIWRKAQAD